MFSVLLLVQRVFLLALFVSSTLPTGGWISKLLSIQTTEHTQQQKRMNRCRVQQREWISGSGAEAQVEAGSLRPHPPASVVRVFPRAELLAQKQPYFSLSLLSYLQTTFHSQSGTHNEGGGERTSVSSLKNIYKNTQGSPSTKSQWS